MEWMEDLYRGLGIEHASIVGISLGGWIAARWTIARPARVESLVLVSASGFRPAKVSFLLRAVLLMFLGDYGLKRLERLLFRRAEIDPQISSYFRLCSRGFNPRRELPPLFTDQELEHITVPLLYIGGERDVLIDIPGSIARIHSTIPGAKTRILKGEGHALTSIGAIVEEFLRLNSSAALSKSRPGV